MCFGPSVVERTIGSHWTEGWRWHSRPPKMYNPNTPCALLVLQRPILAVDQPEHTVVVVGHGAEGSSRTLFVCTQVKRGISSLFLLGARSVGHSPDRGASHGQRWELRRCAAEVLWDAWESDMPRFNAFIQGVNGVAHVAHWGLDPQPVPWLPRVWDTGGVGDTVGSRTEDVLYWCEGTADYRVCATTDGRAVCPLLSNTLPPSLVRRLVRCELLQPRGRRGSLGNGYRVSRSFPQRNLYASADGSCLVVCLVALCSEAGPFVLGLQQIGAESRPLSVAFGLGRGSPPTVPTVRQALSGAVHDHHDFIHYHLNHRTGGDGDPNLSAH